MKLDKNIKGDLFRYKGRIDFRNLLYFLLLKPSFRFLVFFRLSQKYAIRSPWGGFYYLMYRRYSIKYGFQIPRAVRVGRGLYLPHYGNIVINSKTIIGDNCNILQGVTIGNTKRGDIEGVPIIGNNVYIAPNAVIIGDIKIGNNVLIAPNAFVNVDVPDNSIVIGNPAIIKSRLTATDNYIMNIYRD